MYEFLRRMADRSEYQYIPSGGMPCYLLDRVGDDSSNYSDGVFRIFIGTDSSSSIENNTDISDSINTLSNSSLFNLSTVGSVTDTLRVSDQKLLEYQSSINISSIDSGLCDSRNTQCDIALNLNNRSLVNTVQEEATEVTMLSNTSLMDISCNIPMYFTTDESQNNNVDFDKQLYSNNSTKSGNIFIECIRLFVHNKDESGYDKNIKDPSISLFSMNCKKVQQFLIILGSIPSDEIQENKDEFSHCVKIIEPTFDACCLWGNSSVTVCGATLRCKILFFYADIYFFIDRLLVLAIYPC